MDDEFWYVWFNIHEGTFSNPWRKSEMNNGVEELIDFSKSNLENGIKPGHKLIKFQCLNDSDFTFYNQMKVR